MPKSLKSAIWTFISDADGGIGKLPLVHNTDTYRFDRIRTEGLIKAKACPIFNEKLIYLFYGRPSYRVHPNVRATDADWFAPICLIMNNDLISGAHRLMPFDTGAFAGDRMKDIFHPDMEMTDFELDVATDAPT